MDHADPTCLLCGAALRRPGPTGGRTPRYCREGTPGSTCRDLAQVTAEVARIQAVRLAELPAARRAVFVSGRVPTLVRLIVELATASAEGDDV